MFNYIFKSTIRHLKTQKWFVLYSIIGFTIGFASLLIISLYVIQEKNYDTFHTNYKNIYRLEDEWTLRGNRQHSAATNAYLLPDILENYPEVTSGVRLLKSIWTAIVVADNKKFPEDKFCFVDSTFFSFFSFRLIHGNPSDVLNSPSKVVISKSTAIKYFGTDDVLGRQIIYQQAPYIVSGVFEDMPEQSHFHFNLVFNIDYLMKMFREKDKADNIFYSYILVSDKANAGQLSKNLNANLKSINGYKQRLSDNIATCKVKFQPLKDIHLHGNAEREIEKNGKAALVSILKLVGILILVIACINYSNMGIAKSLGRAKEMGISKIFGSEKKIVFIQFMAESFLLVLISVFIAVFIVIMLLSAINYFFGTQLEPMGLISPAPLGIILLSILGISILSGIYPAIYLSGLKPLRAIKLGDGKFSTGRAGIPLRKVFMVVQLSISVFFIASIIMINKQYNYLQNQLLGFDKENIVVIPLKGFEVRNRNVLSVFKQELLKSGNVINASVTDVVPGERFVYLTARFPGLVTKGSLATKEPDGSIWLRFLQCDEDIVQTLGLEIIEGKNFPVNGTNKELYMINEAAVKQLGLTNPLEEPIEFTQFNSNPPKGKIIAVVKDFNFASLHTAVEPVVIRLTNSRRLNLIVKVTNTDRELLMTHIERTWKRFFPDIPFDYYHLNDRYEQLYATEANMKKLFGVVTFIAILLSCMGLLGMSFYMLEHRKKEIGIRKVVGADISLVMQLIYREFFILGLIANLLASIPVTWFLHKWLQNFAYHNGISVTAFIYALVVSVFFTLAIVSIHTYKAANLNPVKAIKNE